MRIARALPLAQHMKAICVLYGKRVVACIYYNKNARQISGVYPRDTHTAHLTSTPLVSYHPCSALGFTRRSRGREIIRGVPREHRQRTLLDGTVGQQRAPARDVEASKAVSKLRKGVS